MSRRLSGFYPIVSGNVICVIIVLFLTGCATYHAKDLSPFQKASSFEARTLDSSDLKTFLQANLHPELSTWPPGSWNFPTLTLVAFYYHPDLDVARAKWGVAQAAIITAGQLPNPTVGLTPQYDVNPAQGTLSPWLLDFKLDIPIETAGKRGYRIAQAKHVSDSARFNIAATAWQVRSRLRRSLLSLFSAERSIITLERQLAIQKDLVELMQKRLAVGEVSRPDVTQARLSLDQAGLSLNDANKKRAEARAQTAEALGLTVSAINGIEISFALFEDLPVELPSADLRRQGFVSRPDILAALLDYRASESALRLEIAKQYPDVSIGPAYTFDQGENKIGGGLSLVLPVFNQNKGPIAEAEARRRQAEVTLVSLQAKVIGEVDLTLAGYRAARQKLEVADTIVSDKKRQLESTRAMFNRGEVDRLALLSAEFELLSSRVSWLDTLVQAQQSLGLLEDALQSPLGSSATPLTVPEKSPRPEDK